MDQAHTSTAVEIPGVDDLVEIGRGGFSVVYRGRQRDLERDVAVKVVLSRGTGGDALGRWQREVTAMARLSNHPNIVAVYSGGVTADGWPYLVMPYVPDGSLKDRVQQHGPMPADDVAAIGVKLAGALASAHEAGVLHRDVKPENVLVSPYGEPQLADFGIARLLDSTATATRTVHATIQYAAPEVLAGHPATEAADVYGLGATLYALLAGASPFPAGPDDSLVSLVGRIATQPPPALDPRVAPAPLMAVLSDALAKTPEDRIPTADALRDRLEDARRAMASGIPAATTAVVGPATVVAPVLESRTTEVPVAPAAVAYRAAPRPRRSRGGAILAALFVLILLAVVAIALVAAGRDDGSPTASTTASSTPETTAASTTATTAPTTTTAPSTTTTSAAPPATPVSGTIEDTASTYFGAIGRGDLGSAYKLLSAGFQKAQSREDFEAFWGSFDSVRVAGPIEVDEGARTATVPLELDGSSETMTLSLVEEDGDWRIDGPRPG